MISEETLNDTSASFISENSQNRDEDSEEDESDEDKEDEDERSSNRLTLRKDKVMKEYDRAMKKNITTF